MYIVNSLTQMDAIVKEDTIKSGAIRGQSSGNVFVFHVLGKLELMSLGLQSLLSVLTCSSVMVIRLEVSFVGGC